MAPTRPLVGLRLLNCGGGNGAGSTVNGSSERVAPTALLTVIGPSIAPGGTLVVSLPPLGSTSTSVAGTPAKATWLSGLKPEPARVTLP